MTDMDRDRLLRRFDLMTEELRFAVARAVATRRATDAGLNADAVTVVVRRTMEVYHEEFSLREWRELIDQEIQIQATHDTDPKVICTGWTRPHPLVVLKDGNPNLVSRGMCPACSAEMHAQADAKQYEREKR